MKQNLIKNNNSKEIIIFFVLLLMAITPVFAQGIVPSGLNSFFDQLVDVFNGPIVKAILIMCLCGCAIAYAFNKDNEKMKRNVIAIGIAIIILMAAGEIVGAVMRAAR